MLSWLVFLKYTNSKQFISHEQIKKLRIKFAIYKDYFVIIAIL